VIRLEQRTRVPFVIALVAPIAAVAFTLLVCAGFIIWAGAPVGRAYLVLFDGAFGSRFAIGETLTRATPLILTGLAAAVAFRAHFYNIGAEGQLYLGALAAVAVGGGAITAPPVLLFPVMIAAGMAAGALWLLVPALAKTRLGVDEVVTTLLLNFVALLFVSMMLDGPMKDPTAMGWPQSVTLPAELEFSKLLERSRVHSGLIFAAVLAVLLWVVNTRTTLGYEMRAVGANAKAARFAGISVNAVMLRTARGWRALAKSPGAPGISRSTCRPVTAIPASSSRCWRG
jgi:simple sugar transport system permease protein